MLQMQTRAASAARGPAMMTHQPQTHLLPPILTERVLRTPRVGRGTCGRRTCQGGMGLDPGLAPGRNNPPVRLDRGKIKL